MKSSLPLKAALLSAATICLLGSSRAAAADTFCSHGKEIIDEDRNYATHATRLITGDFDGDGKEDKLCKDVRKDDSNNNRLLEWLVLGKWKKALFGHVERVVYTPQFQNHHRDTRRQDHLGLHGSAKGLLGERAPMRRASLRASQRSALVLDVHSHASAGRVAVVSRGCRERSTLARALRSSVLAFVDDHRFDCT